MHLLTIVLPSALATANRITEPGSASDSAHSRHGARRSRASNERLEELRPPARATMKNYFTHSGKQESREVTITELDMGTFDYFCNPSVFGKNAGAGQCSKRLASAAGGLPFYLWEKCRGRAVQQKIGECYRWGLPAIFGKNAGAGQCSEKLACATAGGATPHLWEKCRGKAVQQKIGERYRWGAAPLSLAKMQGQGSAVKNWRALLGGYPSSLGKMQGQGSAAKLASAAGGLPLYLAGAVKIWRVLPLGGDPCIFG